MDTVTIPLVRYEELLDSETRVNVAVECIVNNKYIDNEDILRILGTKLAMKKANEIREENRKRDEEYEKRREEDANAQMS